MIRTPDDARPADAPRSGSPATSGPWPTPGCPRARPPAPVRRAGPSSQLGHQLYNSEAGLNIVSNEPADLQDHGCPGPVLPAVHRAPRLQLRHRLRGREQLPAARRDSSWTRSGRRPRTWCRVSTAPGGRREHRAAAHRRPRPGHRARRRRRRRRGGGPAGRGQSRDGECRLGPGHHRPGADRARRLPGRRGGVLALRFEPKMAIGAMVALLHDIIVTAGIYSLIGFEVTPSTVIGFLTILGFSCTTRSSCSTRSTRTRRAWSTAPV